MAVKEVDDPSLYGVVVHDDDMRVVGFQEKPPREEALSDAVQLRHLRVRAARSSTTCARRVRRLGQGRLPGAAGATSVPFHCWRARELLERRRQHRAVPPRATSTPCSGRVDARRPRPRDRARACGSARAREIEAGVRLEPPVLSAPAASSSPAPSSSARSSSATAASSSAAPCSRASSTGTASRPAATRASPAASSAATWSCTTRPSCTRTPSSATAPRSAPHALVAAGARLEPRTCVGPDASRGGGAE